MSIEHDSQAGTSESVVYIWASCACYWSMTTLATKRFHEVHCYGKTTIGAPQGSVLGSIISKGWLWKWRQMTTRLAITS